MKGKNRLATHALKFLFRKENILLPLNTGQKLCVPHICEPIALSIFQKGVYEEFTHKFLIGETKQDSTVFDIGANIGAICVPWSRFLKQGRIFAFECSPKVIKFLESNIEMNGIRNITVVNKAVANFTGKQPFYIPPDSHFGMGSLGAQFNPHPIEVETIELDDFVELNALEKIDVIKLDIEGAEGLALDGAKKLLARKNAPAILFESCEYALRNLTLSKKRLTPIEPQRYLKSFGYQIWRLEDYLQSRPPLTDLDANSYSVLVAKK